jgi:hypothetical protein
MKKLLLTFVAMLLTLTANAYNFEDNGIYFNLKSDGNLEVAGLASWTNRADIPSSITVGGVKYRVTSIAAYAFDGRSDLTYLSIPYSIKSIGEFAFVNCGSNITVNIADPESWCQMQLGNEHASPLSSAGKMLVYDIETDRIDIPSTVTSIGAFTFYQCSCIKTVNIPSSVTSIGSSAFEDCDYLTSLSLNDGLQSIGGSAFEGCKRLATLVIPSTVNKILVNAFKNCVSLTNVYCNTTAVPNTDASAFNGVATENVTLHVPASAVNSYKAAWPWSNFKMENQPVVPTGFKVGGISYYTINGESVGVSTQIYAGDMVIPSTVTYDGKTYIVTTIPADQSDGYEPYTQLTSLVIPNSVTTIGEEAFGPCFSLKSLTIGSGVTSIGWGAFRGCTSLKTVVSKIQKPFAIKDVFLNLPSDAELIVPKGTKAAYQSTEGWNAFGKITEAIDPSDLTDNGIYYTLKSDGTLEVTGLASWATTADIPSSLNISGTKYSVTSIAARAFEGRSDLTYLSIPYSIKSIGEYAFADCGSNITVNIADPESWCQMQLGNEHASPLSSAGKMLVHDIETTSFEVPSAVTSIGAFTFYQCSCLKSLYIPSSVTSIGSSAFEDCDYLTSVTLNEGLQSIGGSAFEGCKRLASITIPSTVNTISINAFKNCVSLTDVYCNAVNVPNTDATAFNGVFFEKITLHVPDNAVNAYAATWPWSNFNMSGKTAIDGVLYSDKADADIYSINGYQTSKLQRGLNIIRQKDGKVRKVLVR